MSRFTITPIRNSAIYLSSRGLGSPFPEDAKLCAMLNSFWPAVAPDAARTFGQTPTGIPLLDTELGLHPQHRALQPIQGPSKMFGAERGAAVADVRFVPLAFEFVEPANQAQHPLRRFG